MNTLKRIIILFIVAHCSAISVAQDHSQWSYNLSIYEVNLRQYTKEGTIASFTKHLDRLQDLGVGIIWFMPIHPIGVKNRLGSLGSYYSVKDYLNVNSEFGTMQEFKALVDSIHGRGMYVLIDWVGNHTSWDNGLTQSHPEWYEKNGNGAFVAPHGTNWTDVIQLDYTKQELRTYMINTMKYWITDVHVDGFRCDAASFVPIDFWLQAISDLKKIKPDLLMVAEDDGVQYNAAGFDMTYSWKQYGFGNGILINLAKGNINANDFYTFVQAEHGSFPPPYLRMYFTSNHDENSWYGTEVELFGSAAEQFSILSQIERSVGLLYGGQEAGLDHRLKFFDKDEILWKPYSMTQKYKALLHLKRNNSALWNGASGEEPSRISTSNDQAIYVFQRKREKEKVIGLFNFSNQLVSFSLTGIGYAGTYKDIFTELAISIPENYELSLPAWGYKILEKSNPSSTVLETGHAPNYFSMEQNYPNPFNPSTMIDYQLPMNSLVTLKVYDVLGREVAVLVNEQKEPGTYSVQWNAAQFTGGIYFATMKASQIDGGQAGCFTVSKKLLLMK